MKPKIKKLWVDALRSGQYKQTKNKLQTNEGYCCLGVLCDIYAKQTKKGSWKMSELNDLSMDFIDINDISQFVLTDGVIKWSKVTTGYHVMINNIALTTYNDKLNYSFAEIADLIVENL